MIMSPLRYLFPLDHKKFMFKISLRHQALALFSPKQMKYTDIKLGLLIQETFTSIPQERISNLDLAPDLEPSYGIASLLKYAKKGLQKISS